MRLARVLLRGAMSWGLAVWVLMLAAGCSSDRDYFPLRVGDSKTYSVRTGSATFVEPVRVTRRISTAGSDGFELTGRMGVSRLAWSRDGLLADRFSGAAFSPAITLLDPSKPKSTRRWRGTLMGPAGESRAEATIRQEPAKLKVGAREYETLRTRIVLRAGPDKIEVESWYAPGIGLLRQNHRTNDKFDLSIERIDPRASQ
jgi:hypothetical protein